MKNTFKDGWYIAKMPIHAKVAVIDNSYKVQIGLSAMQIHALENPSRVTLEFVGKKIKAEIWNAGGMACTKGCEDIRITKPIADVLRCKVGEFITISDKDMTLKPLGI